MPFDDISVHPARQELVELNKLIAAAQAKRATAQEVVERFERPAAEVQIARNELDRLKLSHDAAIVSWYEAGCTGDRPETPAQLLQLEHRLGQLVRNVGAVEDRLAAAVEVLQRENIALGELQVRHRSAVYRAVTEAAQDRLHAKAVPALISMLAEFAVVESLAAVLRGYGPTDPDGASASQELYRKILVARSSTAVRGNLDAARAFIAEISTNPDLGIPDPGDPLVEQLEVRLPAPPIDGSQFINRGPVEELSQPAEEFHPNPATDPDGAWRHMHPDPAWADRSAEAFTPTFMPTPHS
jgi:hypothetical protein